MILPFTLILGEDFKSMEESTTKTITEIRLIVLQRCTRMRELDHSTLELGSVYSKLPLLQLFNSQSMICLRLSKYIESDTRLYFIKFVFSSLSFIYKKKERRKQLIIINNTFLFLSL